MAKIIPLASGKGGVGKTTFVANLGVLLAQKGKTVILVDLDLGGSNLHTYLGVKNSGVGIGEFIKKPKEIAFESLILPTRYPRLYLIPGDALYVGVANVNFGLRRKIIKEIESLVADYILVDLGSGTNSYILDFFLISYSGILVTVPETTAILNAYSFLKNSFFRLIYLSFPPKTPERIIMEEFIKKKIEGTSASLLDMIKELSNVSPASLVKAKALSTRFFPRVVLNKVEDSDDLIMADKFTEIVKKNIGLPLEFIGYIESENHLREAINTRVPHIIRHPNSRFRNNLEFILRGIEEAPEVGSPYLYDDLEQMQEKQLEFLATHNIGVLNDRRKIK